MVSAPGVPAAGSAERHRAARTLLREASDEPLDRHPRPNISAEPFDGQPAASLARATAGASMLVLGSRKPGTLRGFVLGSGGRAVIHCVEQPAVLVRATEDALPHAQGRHLDRGVVVGVDTGRPCDALLSFAFAEASRRGRTLHALHSWMPPPPAGSGYAYNPEVNARIAQVERTDLDDMLRPWRHTYPAAGDGRTLLRATPGGRLRGGAEGRRPPHPPALGRHTHRPGHSRGSPPLHRPRRRHRSHMTTSSCRTAASSWSGCVARLP
ncbi:universal stress protein [Streptomyces sp. NPDC001732]